MRLNHLTVLLLKREVTMRTGPQAQLAQMMARALEGCGKGEGGSEHAQRMGACTMRTPPAH